MSVVPLQRQPQAVAWERPVTVVIADSHPLMRASLRRLLDATPGIRVAAEAGSLALAAQHVAGHRPDVLVIDLDMPDGSSLELTRELRAEQPHLRVIATSLEDVSGYARKALASGASAFVPKERADTDLARAVLAPA